MKKLSLFIYLLIGAYQIGAQISSFGLDQYLQMILKEEPIPGFSVVVVQKDQVVFSKGYGFEKHGESKLMTPNTVSAIGSLTKSFTALAMMQLVEQGKVELDAPVIKYLPWFRTANKERSDLISIKMLLNNTSGLYGGVSNIKDASEASLEQLVRSLNGTYLHTDPGESYNYSNTGFAVAGLLISKISGMPYADYLERYILEPLQMHRTTTNPAKFDQLNTLYGHYLGIEGGVPASKGLISGEMIPAGSLMRSTANDLGQYLIALLNNGLYKGHQLISPQSLELMWSPSANFIGLPYEDGGDNTDDYYGLGWMLSEIDGRNLIHHGGSVGTMSSMTMVNREKKIAISMLFNLDLTLIDKYRHKTLFHISNNAMHAFEGKAPSDFGVVRMADPTENTFELNDKLKSRYLGAYLMDGIGDWLFYGVHLEVFLNPGNEIEVQIWRGKERISNFRLDFVNQAYAIGRNIGMPLPVHFSISPKGEVSGLVYSNTKFKKRRADYFQSYAQITSPDQAFSFYFPASWKYEWCDNTFVAQKGQYLAVSGITGYSDMTKLLKDHFSNHYIIKEGILHQESKGPLLWLQQSFVSTSGKQEFQHYVLINQQKDHSFYYIHTTEKGALTYDVQGVVNNLMESFWWSSL